MATYKSKKAYMYGTGRRKSSVARVHLYPGGTGSITINGRDIDDYFGLETLKLIVRQPLVTTGTLGKVDIETTVSGGGVTGQAGAIRHGIARALLAVDESFRAPLKAAGFLRPQSRSSRSAVQQALNGTSNWFKDVQGPRSPAASGAFLIAAAAPRCRCRSFAGRSPRLAVRRQPRCR